MNTMISILIIVTSFTNINQNHKTGVWLEEFAIPYNEFSEMGYKITVASIPGGNIPIDPRSLPNDNQAKEWSLAMASLKLSTKLSEINPKNYNAVFIPGGYGAMFDLPNDLIVKNKTLTSFTNSEEEKAGLYKEMPFLLEDELKNKGALFVNKPNWSDHVEISENLITGQNPQSTLSVAKAIIEKLKEEK